MSDGDRTQQCLHVSVVVGLDGLGDLFVQRMEQTGPELLPMPLTLPTAVMASRVLTKSNVRVVRGEARNPCDPHPGRGQGARTLLQIAVCYVFLFHVVELNHIPYRIICKVSCGLLSLYY